MKNTCIHVCCIIACSSTPPIIFTQYTYMYMCSIYMYIRIHTCTYVYTAERCDIRIYMYAGSRWYKPERDPDIQIPYCLCDKRFYRPGARHCGDSPIYQSSTYRKETTNIQKFRTNLKPCFSPVSAQLSFLQIPPNSVSRADRSHSYYQFWRMH